MGSNWTRNLNTEGLVGFGASLCARYLHLPDYIQTNATLFGDKRFRAQILRPPAGDTYHVAYIFVDPTARFPYGIPVTPP